MIGEKDAEARYGWHSDMSDQDNLSNVLGVCGCGDPDEVMRLFLRSLERMDPERPKRHYEAELRENFGMEKALNNPLVWAHLYQLDHLELAEHGGTAWCGWLTPKGEFVRDKLRAFLAKEAGRDE